MTTLVEISKQQDVLKKEIEKLESNKQDIINSGKDGRQYQLAEMLHSLNCRHNHTDMCDWFYDTGNWNSYARKEYLKQAKSLISYGTITVDFENTPLDRVERILKIINNY